MRQNFVRNGILLTIAFCLIAINLGCGSKVDGKYSGADGLFTVEFKSGKATITTSMLGNKSVDTADYTVSGDTVTIKTKDGNMDLKIQSDGSLQGPQGTLKKVSS